MINEEYNELSEYEKTEFRKVCNTLLSCSYIVKEKYDHSKEVTILNEKYRICKKLLPIIKDYFYYIGWTVELDETYEYISCLSMYQNNRLKFDRFTTLFLYTLRLIFEEEREKASNHKNIRTDTTYIIQKMASFGLLKNGKSTISERIYTQKLLAHHNIIEKIESAWLSDGNRLIIHPSILSIIPNADISSMVSELEENRYSDNIAYDENTDFTITNQEDV